MAAAERVKERLYRTTAALEAAGVPYAVIGGNAVAEWVGRADPAAVRITKDVDILLRRADLPAAVAALAAAGFVHGEAGGIDFFLDGPDTTPRDAVHVVFANEKVRDHSLAAAPDVSESERGAGFQVLAFDALLRMKLAAFRLKDRIHLLDMIDVGQIDGSWTGRLPAELAARLQQLLDNPEG